MELKLNVRCLTVRNFNPTQLVIVIRSKEETHLKVTTILTEITSRGSIVETANHDFPLSTLAVFNGFDTETLEPKINETVLNGLLANFGLELN